MRRPASAGKKRAISENTIPDDGDNAHDETAPPHPKKRCSRANDVAVEVSENQIGEMQKLEEELQKEKPDKKYVKNAMKTTYQARRKWVLEECPPMSAIMDKYPVLTKQAYVCYFYKVIFYLFLQLRQEAQYVLEGYKCGYDFDKAREISHPCHTHFTNFTHTLHQLYTFHSHFITALHTLHSNTTSQQILDMHFTATSQQYQTYFTHTYLHFTMASQQLHTHFRHV